MSDVDVVAALAKRVDALEKEIAGLNTFIELAFGVQLHVGASGCVSTNHVCRTSYMDSGGEQGL